MKDFRRIYQEEGAYHLDAEGFKAWFLKENYAAIARRCKGAERILDIGCGEGCLAQYLDADYLVGVDFSSEALALARRYHENAYDDLHQADLRDIGDLPIAPGTFDAVVCSLTLMYLLPEDLPICLAGVLRVLAEDGRFIITYPTWSDIRKPSPEAAELRPSALSQIFFDTGFSMIEMAGFCPLVPQAVIEASRDPKTCDEAYVAFEASQRSMTLETSYHFIAVAVKKNR